MRLALVGIGPVRIGMTGAEVRRVLANGLKLTDYDGGDCTYLETEPDIGISFMMRNRRVVRVDVSKEGWRTISGAGIGTSEGEIRQLYAGRLTIEPHQYVSEGKYLIVREPTYKGYEMLFETDGKAVTEFRAGLAEAVRLAEGCS
jgi:hypothetical protein